MTSPRAEYDRRLALWRARIATLDRTHLLMSNGRLLLGVAGGVLLWLAFIRWSVSGFLPIACWLAFGALAVAHARLLNRVDRARRAETVYLRGLDRLAGRWPGTGRDGALFLQGHPYARDLDLFGRASLFELLNTTRTEAGEATLADWLRAGAAIPEVVARQGAVDELKSKLDLRENVAVLAAESGVGRTGALGIWAAGAPPGFPPALRGFFAACAAGTIALSVATFYGVLEPVWASIWIVATVALASIWRKRLRHVLHAIETPEHDLALLVDLMRCVEREAFTSARLTSLQQTLVTDGMPPSKRIAQLRTLVSWIDSTHNLLFAPFAFVLLVREQLALAILAWHRRYGSAVAEWLRVVGELEALVAIGTYAYERPTDPFPTLVEEGPFFDADGLRHPLIHDDVAVANAVRLGGADAPRVVIVSGSNMSGKSTLLRSVGINVVLALAGGPVNASRMRLSPLVLGATLRIEDSLEAGVSRFYAEILRIRAIVGDARGPVPLLFLLDEILHGTNSYDRRIGAEAIVRALVAAGAIGLVTTHDLALTELTGTMGSAAVNMHFEDRLVNGVMVFDYRMRPGVVEHSNALALMRAIGLDV